MGQARFLVCPLTQPFPGRLVFFPDALQRFPSGLEPLFRKRDLAFLFSGLFLNGFDLLRQLRPFFIKRLEAENDVFPLLLEARLHFRLHSHFLGQRLQGGLLGMRPVIHLPVPLSQFRQRSFLFHQRQVHGFHFGLNPGELGRFRDFLLHQVLGGTHFFSRRPSQLIVGIGVQDQFGFPDLLADRLEAPGLGCLALQRPHLRLHLPEDVFHPLKIGFGLFDLPL